MTPAELTLATLVCNVHRSSPEPQCVACTLVKALRYALSSKSELRRELDELDRRLRDEVAGRNAAEQRARDAEAQLPHGHLA